VALRARFKAASLSSAISRSVISPMVRIKPIVLGLNKTQLEALGLFTAQWTFLETEIEFTISCLGAAVDNDQTVPFPFDQKIKRWKRLAKAHYTDSVTFAHCEKLIADAKSAQNLRTIFAHGRLEGDPTGKKKSIFIEHNRHRRTGWHVQPYNFPASAVRRWAIEVGRLSASLIKFNLKHLPGRPGTLPRKFASQHLRPYPRLGSKDQARKSRLQSFPGTVHFHKP
jgi:hypothetical protein